MRVIKIITPIMVFLIVISPVLYGLYRYNWNIAKFISPTYETPSIRFEYRVSGFKLSKEGVVISVNITDLTNFEIKILNISGYVYIGKSKAPVRLLNQVYLKPNQTSKLDILFKPTDEFIKYIIYDLIRRGSIDLKLDLKALVDIYGALITIPIKVSKPISASEIGLPRNISQYIRFEYAGSYVKDGYLIIRIKLSTLLGKTIIPISKIELLNLSGHAILETGESTLIKLVRPVEILKTGSTYAEIALALKRDFLKALVDELIRTGSVRIISEISPIVSINGIVLEIPKVKIVKVIEAKELGLAKEPIKIAFGGVSLSKDYLILHVDIANNLNRTINLIDLTGGIHVLNASASIRLLKSVRIEANSVTTADILIKPTSEFIKALFTSLMSYGNVSIEVKAIAKINVLNTTIGIPILIRHVVSINEFGISKDYLIARYQGISLATDRILVNISVINRLPVDIEITNISGELMLYNTSADVGLLHKAYIKAGKTENITLVVRLNKLFIKTLIKTLLRVDVFNMTLLLKCHNVIYTAKIIYPISKVITVSKTDLGLDPRNITVSLLNLTLTTDKLLINISVINRLPWNISIVRSNLKLHYENGTFITDLNTHLPIDIAFNTNITITYITELSLQQYISIYNYLKSGGSLVIKGSIEVSLYDVRYPIEVNVVYRRSG